MAWRDARAAAPPEAGGGGGRGTDGPARAAARRATTAGGAGRESSGEGGLLRGAALEEVLQGRSSRSWKFGGGSRGCAACSGGRVSIGGSTTSLSEGGETIAVLGGLKSRGSCPGN